MGFNNLPLTKRMKKRRAKEVKKGLDIFRIKVNAGV